MWPKNLVEHLIMLYREHINLYNTKHEDYTDRNKRNESYEIIYESLKEINKRVTMEEIKKKIHTIRTQYMREVRAMSGKGNKGIAVDPDYKVKLWCYDQMEFLRPYVQFKETMTIPAIEFAVEKNLIHEIQKYDILWNTNHRHYKNTARKDICWAKVASTVDLKQEFCRKRWRSLKERFAKELINKENESEDEEDLSKPEWRHFERMMFLKGHVNYRKNRLSNISEGYEEHTYCEDNETMSFEKMDNDTDVKYFDFINTKPIHDMDGIEEEEEEETVENYFVESPPQSNLTQPNSFTKDEYNDDDDDDDRKSEKHSNRIINQRIDDPFLGAIGEIFDRLPVEHRLSFKMDVLNFAYEKFNRIKK